ncbi:THUMP domain-containing protein 1 homolog [Procambarus clarkii]|uniref:THUMP domain-containing protein 1 homolog n=1 Tax=Procambarus clarkii TaxID=6728 RepID=UPI001E66FFCC|nr:THUMP domain-containing protein 1 homolog [Procambarus clarkii]
MGKNKRSKGYYIQSAKRQKRHESFLGPDMTGFMCTCNEHERDCVREAYNILNEFADQLFGKEDFAKQNMDKDDNEVSKTESATDTNTSDGQGKMEKGSKKEAGESLDDGKTDGREDNNASDSDDDTLDVEAAVKADVLELQKKNHDHKHERRFQQVNCGAKNCVFIRTTLDDPLPLSVAIMDDILQNQKQRTKRLLRMIPVQKTCKAFQEDIEKAVGNLAKSYFEKESKTFYVVIKIRNNTTLPREQLTNALVQIIQDANSKNTPDLKYPDVVLNVDVIKNICCLSFLPGYFTKYAKYNLIMLADKNKVSVTKAKGDLEDSKGKQDDITKNKEESKEDLEVSKDNDSVTKSTVESKEDLEVSNDKDCVTKSTVESTKDLEVSKDNECLTKSTEESKENLEVSNNDKETKAHEES